MRLWSIHPSYLDAKGLVALWREGLLAQKVLQGNTKGYMNHPQLKRFKDTTNPTGAIAGYLKYVVDEADNRNYKFDKSKIINKKFCRKIPVTTGQLEHEFTHLLKKVKQRDVKLYIQLKNVKRIKPHSMFIIVSGNIEEWEKH